MALIKEDLLAIRGLMREENADMRSDIATIKEDIAEIKEHAEVARSAINSLVESADTVGVITQVKFPIKKANNG